MKRLFQILILAVAFAACSESAQNQNTAQNAPQNASQNTVQNQTAAQNSASNAPQAADQSQNAAQSSPPNVAQTATPNQTPSANSQPTGPQATVQNQNIVQTIQSIPTETPQQKAVQIDVQNEKIVASVPNVNKLKVTKGATFTIKIPIYKTTNMHYDWWLTERPDDKVISFLSRSFELESKDGSAMTILKCKAIGVGKYAARFRYFRPGVKEDMTYADAHIKIYNIEVTD